MNNKGFTVIEIIVSLFISSFIMITILGLFLSFSNMASDMEIQSYRSTYVDNVYKYIKNSLVYSQKISISENSSGGAYLKVKDGTLYNEEGEVSFPFAYLGDIEIKVKKINFDTVFLQVLLLDKNDHSLLLKETSGKFKIRGLESLNGYILGDIGVLYTNPTISFK